MNNPVYPRYYLIKSLLFTLEILFFLMFYCFCMPVECHLIMNYLTVYVT